MRLLTKIIYTKFLIGLTAAIVFVCLNQEYTKEHLPLPIRVETKEELVGQREYLNGDPFKIQLWINENITGKSDGCIQYAQTPEETYKRRTGDCEDYAIIAKYFLGVRYEEIHIVVWDGKFTEDSKYYSKNKNRTIIHAVCLFKINDGWGIIDNNGFVMTSGTLEDAVRFSSRLRYVKVKRAYTAKFYRYAYRRLKRII